MDISKKILENNKPHVPMVETEYFKWLRHENVKNVHAIETKSEFLKKKYGFVRGIDVLDGKSLGVLKSIESFYYDFYVRNK